MSTCYQKFILICVFGNLVSEQASATFTSFLDVNLPDCDETSSLPGYGIVVTKGKPSHEDGKVVIASSLNKSLVVAVDLCTWTYSVQGVLIYISDRSCAGGSNISWPFSKPGLHKVLVTVQFQYEALQTIKNCTFVNVTDCYLTSRVRASTSTGSYNISQNHTDVTIDSPGFVNFTLFISMTDPYFICKHLYFTWKFGDGRNTSGSHTNHYYNMTGVYCAVLKIFKFFDNDRRVFVRNVTFQVHVKEKHAPTKANNTVIDVSLVLAIFFVCFVFVLCIAAYWFRRRRHRHTEVARFDFRSSEFQSSFDEHSRLNPRSDCLNTMTCRRGSNEHLLNFSNSVQYSSCRKFYGDNPNDEL